MATVMIIDDEYGIAELLEAVLVDEGHRILTAANGQQGLDVMRANKPDVIFLDYMMPVMDGATTLARVKSSQDLCEVPVVIMSSIPESAVAERCSGYALFLRKPFSVFHVIEVVNQLVSTEGSTPPPSL